jgi:hypothetical protein
MTTKRFKEPSFLRNVVIVALLFTPIGALLFLCAWLEHESIEAAWDTFDTFVYNCLD